MSIRLLFTPNNEAEKIFKTAECDILIMSPNIKYGFMQFIDKIASSKKIVPRLITSVSSEAGSEWDRERSFSDYPDLVRRCEEGNWQIRVARFNLRAYCVDHRIAIVSSVNPAEDGRLVPGGLWIVFDDPLSSSPIIQRLEYYWSIAKDLKASEVAEALKKKGRDVGEFLDMPPDQNELYRFILAEEAALQAAQYNYENKTSEQTLIDYLNALEPFDRDGLKRIRIAERHLANYGDSWFVRRYLAYLYVCLQNFNEAQRNALLALGEKRDDMDMVSILIITVARSDIKNVPGYISEYEPMFVENSKLLHMIVNVFKSCLEKFPGNKKLVSMLIKVYQRLYELAENDDEKANIRNCANLLAQRNGWNLGW